MKTEKYICIGGPLNMQSHPGGGNYLQALEAMEPFKASMVNGDEVSIGSTFNTHTYKYKEINFMGKIKGFYVSESLSESEGLDQIGAFIITLIDIYTEA